ncbi:hypothetical protein SDRG_14576 [Saprolegnia diclina VS20]|uniref:Secreted protein n=1 Tax=Saprolegnia diclina (strain VS20) TaxID=1156394 RepID=T0R6G4_SAPDV|nr:hypothetical protein SDRG_14576 [Saprolegnia diclina VS20]EQC27668.1 hypothetical protein SDRG_14576 [Saprolegnia diclina VS20]|eukprot:XP_008618936.1 hypothetical protein SDRG_14576 [Saprolegnia diclina VS20]
MRSTLLLAGASAALALDACNVAMMEDVYAVIQGPLGASCASAVGLDTSNAQKMPMDYVFTHITSPTLLDALGKSAACTSWWSAVTKSMATVPNCTLGPVSLQQVQAMTIAQYFAANNDYINHVETNIANNTTDAPIPVLTTVLPTTTTPAATTTKAPVNPTGGASAATISLAIASSLVLYLLLALTATASAVLSPCNFNDLDATYKIIQGPQAVACASAVGLVQVDANKAPLDTIFTKIASPAMLSSLSQAPACTDWWAAVTTSMAYVGSCSLGGVSLRAIQHMTIVEYFTNNNDAINNLPPKVTTSIYDDVPALATTPVVTMAENPTVTLAPTTVPTPTTAAATTKTTVTTAPTSSSVAVTSTMTSLVVLLLVAL